MIPQNITPEMKRRAQNIMKGIWPPDTDPKRTASQKLGQQKIAEMTQGKAPTPGH